jgi:hypothetical protein
MHSIILRALPTAANRICAYSVEDGNVVLRIAYYNFNIEGVKDTLISRCGLFSQYEGDKIHFSAGMGCGASPCSMR